MKYSQIHRHCPGLQTKDMQSCSVVGAEFQFYKLNSGLWMKDDCSKTDLFNAIELINIVKNDFDDRFYKRHIFPQVLKIEKNQK